MINDLSQPVTDMPNNRAQIHPRVTTVRSYRTPVFGGWGPKLG